MILHTFSTLFNQVPICAVATPFKISALDIVFPCRRLANIQTSSIALACSPRLIVSSFRVHTHFPLPYPLTLAYFFSYKTGHLRLQSEKLLAQLQLHSVFTISQPNTLSSLYLLFILKISTMPPRPSSSSSSNGKLGYPMTNIKLKKGDLKKSTPAARTADMEVIDIC